MFSIGAYVVFWSLIANKQSRQSGSQSVSRLRDAFQVMDLAERSLLYKPVPTFPIDF